jgi:hypothetical protein
MRPAAVPRPYRQASFGRLLAPALALCIPSQAETQSPFQFEYAAKTICGLPRNVRNVELPLQRYATILNVHNPTAAMVVLVKRLALAFPPGLEQPGTVAPVALDTLLPDAALAIDCFDLRRRVSNLPSFFEGFVVIQAPARSTSWACTPFLEALMSRTCANARSRWARPKLCTSRTVPTSRCTRPARPATPLL